jgi:hypothetical protein
MNSFERVGRAQLLELVLFWMITGINASLTEIHILARVVQAMVAGPDYRRLLEGRHKLAQHAYD